MKTLFREVAKRVHPDLASHEADRRRRESLMTEANQAFERGDASRLLWIVKQYEARRESPQGTMVAEDIVRGLRDVTLNFRLFVTFLEKFNKDQMKRHRGALAKQVLAATPNGNIHMPVMNFFEEMYGFLYDGYLCEELSWSTFGFHAVRWWAACQDYVIIQRKRKNEGTFFAGFEELAGRFVERDLRSGFNEPSLAEVIRFLENERKLLTQHAQPTPEGNHE